MKKIFYSWKDVQGAVLEIARQMSADNWKPDYIVGLTRGGLVPANLLSQYTGIRMHTLNVSLRDGDDLGPESNLWMAEEAFGYVPTQGEYRQPGETTSDPALRKRILIVDDINDSGATINWIKQDWQSSCLPDDSAWDDIWGDNVRVAVLTNNVGSKENVDYSVWEVSKAQEDCWLVYPWEDFWK
jgi:hypoxanthine phosphoribosyltransferase